MKATQFWCPSAFIVLFFSGYAHAVFEQTTTVFSGYTDVTYENSHNYSGTLAPIILVKLSDRFHFEAELEISVNDDGRSESETEYFDLHYYMNDSTTITMGRFLLPFGQFGPNLHPSWVNKLPTPPGIYGDHHGASPMEALIPVLRDHGVAVQKIWSLADDQKLFIDSFVAFGPRSEGHHHEDVAHSLDEEDEHEDEHEEEHEEEESAHEVGHDEETVHGDAEHSGAEVHTDEPVAIEPPELNFQPAHSDNNDSLAFGGRIGYAWLPGFELGMSYYQANYDEDDELSFEAVGLDFDANFRFIGFRGEYIKTATETRQEQVHEEDGEEHMEVFHDVLNRDGWYLQGVWQMRQLQISSLTPVELVLRRSLVEKPNAAQRWTFGINYWIDPRMVIKVAFEHTDISQSSDDERLLIQFSYGF